MPPFVCKFVGLPKNTTNEDISKLLDRLKVTKIQFPHNAENSEVIRYVEFNERQDLLSVLKTPVLFIKGEIVSAKPVNVEWPPKTPNNPKVSVKSNPPNQNLIKPLANTSEPLNRAIYLYGLPKDVNIAELNGPFSEYTIRSLNLPTESTPYGYIEFEHADQLLLAMQKQNLIIRNVNILMSMVKLPPPPATVAMGNVCSQNLIRSGLEKYLILISLQNASASHTRQSRPQQNQSTSRARDSSADSQMTIASTGNFVKRKYYKKPNPRQHHPNGQHFNKIPKHVLQAALKENNTAVPNVSKRIFLTFYIFD